MKKYTKPANPNTTQQQATRTRFAAAVAAWATLNALQKSAYADKARADKKNLSGFNTFVSAYMATVGAGQTYVAPKDGDLIIFDGSDSSRIEGAVITFRKTGQSTDYQTKTTDANGEAEGALCEEDENYDLIVTAVGYDPYEDTDLTAQQSWPDHDNINLEPI